MPIADKALRKASRKSPVVGEARHAAEGADRHLGPGRDHRRRPAARPADARLRRRGLRQDAAGDGVPRARRDASTASPACSWRSRRPPSELAQNVRSLGFDLDELVAEEEARDRLRPHRAQRDRGDRRIRPRGPVHPPRPRDRLGRRQARRARHASRRCSPASRTRPSCAPSCGGCSAGSRTRRDGGHHRRARRRRADAPRPRGVRLRLRDPARPPRRPTRSRRGACAIVKYRGSAHGTNEYPFLIDEHGISVLPITVAGPEPRGDRRAHLDRHRRGSTTCWAARATTAAAACSCRGTAGHRQDQPRGALRRRAPARAASAACISPSRSRPSQLIRNMRSIGIDLEPGSRRACCRSTRRGRRCTASRRTSCSMHKRVARLRAARS